MSATLLTHPVPVSACRRMVPVEAVIPGILRSKLVARGCAGSSDLLCSPATPAGVRLHQVGTPARWWGHLHLALSRLALQAPLLLSCPPGCLCSRKSTLFSNHEQLSHSGTFLALSRGSPDTLVLFSAFHLLLFPHNPNPAAAAMTPVCLSVTPSLGTLLVYRSHNAEKGFLSRGIRGHKNKAT